jgi:hypothetical protein
LVGTTRAPDYSKNKSSARIVFSYLGFLGRLFFVFDFARFLRFAIIALLDFKFNALLLCDAVSRLGIGSCKFNLRDSSGHSNRQSSRVDIFSGPSADASPRSFDGIGERCVSNAVNTPHVDGLKWRWEVTRKMRS